MIRKPFILGAAAFAAFLLVALASSDGGVQATHTTGSPSSMAVDADPTGNTAISLSTREACVETTAGSDVNVDITISDIPVANPMIGFSVDMIYNPVALSIVAADTTSSLIGSAAGSAEGFAGDEATVPTTLTVGTFLGIGYDLGQPTSAESGSGLLERLTIHVESTAANGSYPLHLITAGLSGTQFPDGIDGGAHYSAQIAVGVTCASLPAIEPPPAKNGDVDCSNTVNAVDALKVLRFNAGLSVTQTLPCIVLGSNIPHVGDVDCNGTVSAVDALKILRFGAGLSVTQTPPCDLMGT